MKFKIDENLPQEIVADLRASGHDADSVHDEGLAGAIDPIVMQRASSEGRAVLTMDKGIADIRAYPPDQYHGLVLFRPNSSGRGYVIAFARRHLTTLLQADLVGRLVVASEAGIWMR